MLENKATENPPFVSDVLRFLATYLYLWVISMCHNYQRPVAMAMVLLNANMPSAVIAMEVIALEMMMIQSMEEILHQLIDGLSHDL